MSKFLKINGKLVKKNGKLVVTDNPAACDCCGDPPPPPGAWFCDNGVCKPCVQGPAREGLILCPQGVQLYPSKQDCDPECVPCNSCELATMTFRVNAQPFTQINTDNGSIDFICDGLQAEVTIALESDGAGGYVGNASPIDAGYFWGSGVSVSVSDCINGKWLVDINGIIGCRTEAGGFQGEQFFGARVRVGCGGKWSGNMGMGITGGFTLDNVRLASEQGPNPLP